MGSVLVKLLMEHVGDALNILVCAFVVLFNLSFAGSLERGCTKKASNEKDRAAWGVLVWSFWTWTGSWFFWFAMYAIRLVGAGFRIDPAATSPVVQLLSDWQSLFLFVASYAIVRAGDPDVTPRSLGRNLVMLIIAALLLDAFLYVNGLLVAGFRNGDSLLRPWSMAISVFAPFAFGLALKLRYKSNWVLFWTGIYAFAQPFAYGAAFDATGGRVVEIIVSSKPALLPPLLPFVELVDEDATATSYTYWIRREAGGMRMTGREVRDVLALFKSQMETIAYWTAYVQLRYEEVIFGFLAVMKLILCATIVFYIRIAQPDMEPNVRVSAPATERKSLVDSWNVYFRWFVGAAALMLATVIWVHGAAVSVVIGSAAFVAIVAAILKGGTELLRSLEKRKP